MSAGSQPHEAVGQRHGVNEAGPHPDPGRHYVSALNYVGKRGNPITLEDKARDWERRLAADAQPPVAEVHTSELRAMVIGSLLGELAARLSPGPAFGPGEHGTALAAIARQLADELLAQTALGRP